MADGWVKLRFLPPYSWVGGSLTNLVSIVFVSFLCGLLLELLMYLVQVGSLVCG